MVKQVIHYSDGSETVINYRGVVVDGVLIPNDKTMDEENKPVEPETEVAVPEVEEETESNEVAE